MEILDSGDRTEFKTGAVRNLREGKGRCDLLPLNIVACHMYPTVDSDEKFYRGDIINAILTNISAYQSDGGSSHLHAALTKLLTLAYCDQKWSIYRTFLMLSQHYEGGAKKYGENNWKCGIPTHIYIDSAVRHLLKYLDGWEDEPHLIACIWNITCCIWTVGVIPEMNDYPNYKYLDK